MFGFGLSLDLDWLVKDFPRESQSCMTDLRRIGWRLFGFPVDGCGDGYVNLRID